MNSKFKRLFKRLFKRTLLSLLVLTVLVSAWLWYGSIDDESVNDYGLLAHIKAVPDEQNGLKLLAYTQAPGFSLLDQASKETLKQHLELKVWDQAFVESILKQHDKHLQNFIATTEKTYFQTTAQAADQVPSYGSEIQLLNLLLLKSMYLAKTAQFDQAIDMLNYALSFSQKMKAERKRMLVSHMVGLAMEDKTLQSIHHLISRYPLSEPQLKAIADSLSKRLPYAQDGYAETFAGEFAFVQANLTSVQSGSHMEDVQNWLRQLVSLESDDDPVASVYAIAALGVLAPNYVLHKNKLLSQTAQHYASLAQQASKPCNQIARNIIDNHTYDFSWRDALAPNGGTKLLSDLKPDFRPYAVRRCVTSSYAASLEAIVAIKRYQLQQHKLPARLDELLPQYLASLPIDTFSGRALLYSAEKRWLYALGDDNKDDGGAEAGAYIFRCDQKPACLNNPTFMLNLPND